MAPPSPLGGVFIAYGKGLPMPKYAHALKGKMKKRGNPAKKKRKTRKGY